MFDHSINLASTIPSDEGKLTREHRWELLLSDAMFAHTNNLVITIHSFSGYLNRSLVKAILPLCELWSFHQLGTYRSEFCRVFDQNSSQCHADVRWSKVLSLSTLLSLRVLWKIDQNLRWNRTFVMRLPITSLTTYFLFRARPNTWIGVLFNLSGFNVLMEQRRNKRASCRIRTHTRTN